MHLNYKHIRLHSYASSTQTHTHVIYTHLQPFFEAQDGYAATLKELLLLHRQLAVQRQHLFTCHTVQALQKSTEVNKLYDVAPARTTYRSGLALLQLRGLALLLLQLALLRGLALLQLRGRTIPIRTSTRACSKRTARPHGCCQTASVCANITNTRIPWK